MGLWMGGSVITVVEFLILGALCIVYCCAKRKLKNEANKREQLKRQQEKK